jgi:hypothetical protein
MSRKNKLKLIYKGTLEDMDLDHIYAESFALLSPEQRLNEAWELVKNYWLSKGKSVNELRLDRTVMLIKRG